MKKYNHAVQYYETDKMGITHHSNYVRWMEEARLFCLKDIGCDFLEIEKKNIVSPVLSIDCAYKKTTTYGDTIEIEVVIKEFKGVKLKLEYIMRNEQGEEVCRGSSLHCFLNDKGMPIRFAKEFPELYDTLMSYVNHE